MEGDKNYWDEWMRRRVSRRRMLQRAGLAGLVAAGGSSLWACGETQTPKAAEPTPAAGKPAATPAATPTPAKPAIKRGGTLKIGVNKMEQPENLDPHTYIQSNNDVYLRPIFDYVVNHDDDLAYVPARSLAESWEAVDDVTLVFKLRKGVKFTDGTEWNAQILKANFDRIANKDTKSPRAYVIDAIKNVDFPDNFTAKIVLKEPMASFLGELAHAGLGMHSPANVTKWGAKDLQRNPIGSGPFAVTEYIPDDHYLLQRNKDYWQKDSKGEQLPFVDALRFVVIPDNTVRLANLRTGVIDLDKMTDLKDVAKLQEDPNFKVILQHGTMSMGTYWNLSRPPISSLNFRKAVAHAINREAIVKVVTFGIAKAYTGFVMPSAAWAYNPNRPVVKYDPVLAKQYLDKALAEGMKPEFNNNVPTGEYMRSAEMVQADLAKIGIKMNIIPEEAATSSYRFWTSFEIDARNVGYTMVPDAHPKIFVAHHSKGQYTPEDGATGNPKWDTPEGYFAKLDPLIDAANRTYDPKKRAEFLDKANEIFVENVGFLGLYYASMAMTVRKNVEGVTFGGDGKGRFDRAWING